MCESVYGKVCWILEKLSRLKVGRCDVGDRVGFIVCFTSQPSLQRECWTAAPAAQVFKKAHQTVNRWWSPLWLRPV